MNRTEHSINTLARNARQFSTAITDQLEIGRLPDDMTHAVEDLSK
jgi:hypothetical protein